MNQYCFINWKCTWFVLKSPMPKQILFPCQPCTQSPLNIKFQWTATAWVSLCVCACHHVCLCLCVFVGGEVVLSDKGMRLEPPGFIWAKQEGPVSVWAMGPHRATNRRCLLTTRTWAPPSLGPTSLSIALSIHTASSVYFFHYPLSSPLLSQAMAWPTFTSPTLDPLMSTMSALFTDHVYVWKWPLCSILSLFMNIHFTNRICS